MVSRAAFLFPGQGSQAVGMGRAACEASPKAEALFKAADEILAMDLTRIMREGPEERLTDTGVAQPALFLASAAALAVLRERGGAPSWVAGHSLGEISALYAAGVIGFEDGLRLVRARGLAMAEAARAHPGTMAAVMGFDGAALERLCAAVSTPEAPCVCANHNTDVQTVISGATSAVEAVMARAKEAGAARVIPLNVAGAFHSPLMQAAADRMADVLKTVTFAPAEVPVVTNVDAAVTREPEAFREKLVRQIVSPVRWFDTLNALLGAGADAFLEVGTGKVLTGMVRRVRRDIPSAYTDDVSGVLALLMGDPSPKMS